MHQCIVVIVCAWNLSLQCRGLLSSWVYGNNFLVSLGVDLNPVVNNDEEDGGAAEVVGKLVKGVVGNHCGDGGVGRRQLVVTRSGFVDADCKSQGSGGFL